MKMRVVLLWAAVAAVGLGAAYVRADDALSPTPTADATADTKATSSTNAVTTSTTTTVTASAGQSTLTKAPPRALASGRAGGAEESTWAKQDLSGLVATTKDSIAKGLEGRADLEALGRYVAQRYASEKAAGKLEWAGWQTLLGQVGAVVPEETRRVMRADLSDALIKDPKQVAGLEAGELLRLGRALVELQDRPTAGALAVTWIVGSSKVNQLGPDDLLLLAWLSGVAPQDAAWPAQRKLMALVPAVFVQSKAPQSSESHYWHKYIEFLHAALGPDTKLAWARQIHQRCVPDAAAIKGLSGQQLMDLVEALRLLGEPETRSLVPAWLDGRRTLSESDPETLAWLAAEVAGTDPTLAAGWSWASLVGSGDLGRLLPHALESLLAVAAGAPATEQDPRSRLVRNKAAALAAAQVLGTHKNGTVAPVAEKYCAAGYLSYLLGQPEKAKAWAQKGYQAAVGTPEAREQLASSTVDRLTLVLKSLELTGQGHTYPELATAVVRLGQSGRLACADPAGAGALLTDEASLKTLRLAVADGVGGARLEVARVWLWASVHAGNLQAYRTLAEQQLAAPSLAADAQASWMLVRAYSELVEAKEEAAKRALSWAQKACSTAKSGQAKLEAAQEMVRYQRQLGQLDAAILALGALKPGLDRDHLRQLVELQDQLRHERGAHAPLPKIHVSKSTKLPASTAPVAPGA